MVWLFFAMSMVTKNGRGTGRTGRVCSERHFGGDGVLWPTKQYGPPRGILYILKCFETPQNFGYKHRNGVLIEDLFAEIRARNDPRLVNKNPPSREHVELDEEAL